jgi:hypothetical protein
VNFFQLGKTFSTFSLFSSLKKYLYIFNRTKHKKVTFTKSSELAFFKMEENLNLARLQISKQGTELCAAFLLYFSKKLKIFELI